MAGYPSWRYHPTKSAYIAQSEEHELAIADGDDEWAHEPYNENHIGKPPANSAVTREKAAELEQPKTVVAPKPVGPQRHEFKTQKEYKEALKTWKG